MQTEKKEPQMNADAAQQVLMQAQKKEHDNCWTEIVAALDKYGFQFNPAVTLNPSFGMRFVVDIVKRQP